MRSMVERIVVEDGVAVGVEIATGVGEKRRHTLRVDAGHIVSNARSRSDARTNCSGRQVVGEAAIRDVKAMRPTSPCFLTHIGLQERHALGRARAGHRLPLALVGAGRRRQRRVQDFHPDDVRAEDGARRRADHHPAADHGAALRPTCADWATHKADIEADLMARLEQTIPGINEHVVLLAERVGADVVAVHVELSRRHAWVGNVT